MAEHESHALVSGAIRVVVVTPEKTVLDETAGFVALPLFDGELGVAAGHAPMIGRLGYGELRIGHGPNARRIYIDGGFVQVSDNIVSVLTNRSLSAEALNVASIEATLEDTKVQKAAGDDQIDRRERQLGQARAQLRVARRTASQR